MASTSAGGKILGGLAAIDLLRDAIGYFAGPAKTGLEAVAGSPVPGGGGKSRYMLTAQDELQIRDYVAKENFRRSVLRAFPGMADAPDLQPLDAQEIIAEAVNRASTQAAEAGAREYAVEQLKTQAAIQPAYANMLGTVASNALYAPNLDPASLTALATGR